MASKVNITKTQLEDIVDSVPVIANDLITVIDSYATKEYVAQEFMKILSNISAITNASLLTSYVDTIDDIRVGPEPTPTPEPSQPETSTPEVSVTST